MYYRAPGSPPGRKRPHAAASEPGLPDQVLSMWKPSSPDQPLPARRIGAILRGRGPSGALADEARALVRMERAVHRVLGGESVGHVRAAGLSSGTIRLVVDSPALGFDCPLQGPRHPCRPADRGGADPKRPGHRAGDRNPARTAAARAGYPDLAGRCARAPLGRAFHRQSAPCADPAPARRPRAPARRSWLARARCGHRRSIGRNGPAVDDRELRRVFVGDDRVRPAVGHERAEKLVVQRMAGLVPRE